MVDGFAGRQGDIQGNSSWRERGSFLETHREKLSLDKFVSYYSAAPWLACLRYIEVEKSRMSSQTYDSPVLDLGCGDGFVASQVLQGLTSIGIDIDEEPLQTARSSGPYSLILNSGARHLPFRDQTFGTVYSNGAMEHMKELEAVIAEIYRVLKMGGRLITFVPSQRFREPPGVLAKLLGQRSWNAFNGFQSHVNLISSDQWRSQLGAAGFVVDTIHRYGSKEFAVTLSLYDLCSKLHMQRRRPFFCLRHSGNMGRVLVRFLRLFKPLPMPKEDDFGSKAGGFWMMIAAHRPS